jgi:hypothetical protein
MTAFWNRPAGRTSLIHNPPPLFIFYHHRQILRLSSVHIDRDRPRSLRSSDKNQPLPFVLGKAQKIRFSVHLKIHLIPHINVILSEVAVREADGNAVEGSL